ncbi:MAG: amidohydrolase family protein, partial [Thermoanaerobaculia bacterium]
MTNWKSAIAALCLIAPILSAQQAPMTVEEYEPKSTLVVPEHPTPRAKYPFIDVHNHQESDMSDADVKKLVADMDSINLAVMVNLSGGWAEQFRKRSAMLKGRYPKRFVTFANIDWHGVDQPGFGERAAKQLEEDVRNGAQGLKIFKDLGMFVTDSKGNRVHTDDPRLDPIWEKAADLGIPVLIHTGEPRAFWLPVDKYNERWLELTLLPSRRRSDPRFASFAQTME